MAGGLCFRVVRPSVRSCVSHLLISIPHDAISVYLVEGFQIKLGESDQHLSGYCWKGFEGQRSEVKVIARPLCTFAAGLHFDGVALRLTSFVYHMPLQRSYIGKITSAPQTEEARRQLLPPSQSHSGSRVQRKSGKGERQLWVSGEKPRKCRCNIFAGHRGRLLILVCPPSWSL